MPRVEIRGQHCTECDDERVGSVRSRDVDRRPLAQLWVRGAANVEARRGGARRGSGLRRLLYTPNRANRTRREVLLLFNSTLWLAR